MIFLTAIFMLNVGVIYSVTTQIWTWENLVHYGVIALNLSIFAMALREHKSFENWVIVCRERGLDTWCKYYFTIIHYYYLLHSIFLVFSLALIPKSSNIEHYESYSRISHHCLAMYTFARMKTTPKVAPHGVFLIQMVELANLFNNSFWNARSLFLSLVMNLYALYCAVVFHQERCVVYSRREMKDCILQFVHIMLWKERHDHMLKILPSWKDAWGIF